MIQQPSLWNDPPPIPGAHLVGKQVRYKNGREMTIECIAAYTQRYGTLYSLSCEGAAGNYIAYADEFIVIGE